MTNIKPYIFSECVKSGIIAKAMVTSFLKYHPTETIHMFGTPRDFKEMGKFENVDYIDISSEGVLEAYNNGHEGTGLIFAKVIQEFAKEYTYCVHIDADIVFRTEALHLLTDKMPEYDLIGGYRLYARNLNGITTLGNFKDVTQTFFFAFNRTKVGNFNLNTLSRMCTGTYNPLGHQVLDFFDPVAFDIQQRGKTFYVSADLLGGLMPEGNRLNKYPEQNFDMDYGDVLMHFAGISSGYKCVVYGYDNINRGYADWGVKRFGLYSLLVLNKKLDNFDYTDPEIVKKYNALKENFPDAPSI